MISRSSSCTIFMLFAGLFINHAVAQNLPNNPTPHYATRTTEDVRRAAMDEILVIGSRHKSDAEALSVPVHILTRDAMEHVPDSDMDDLIARLVPTYNINQQAIDDEATIVRPANLRGLPADATLILVNGKRRHRSSVITFLGGGLSEGAHAPDIASIPTIALERVEVLLDGASAQYGSDAVAGVINFALRTTDIGGEVIARYGKYSAGDGAKTALAAHFGMPLGDGFVNFSLETVTQDATDRSVQRDDAQALIDAGNANIRRPHAQIWGAPEIDEDVKILLNAATSLNDETELYGFANLARRTVTGGFYFRNPHTRSGVYAGPQTDDGLDTIRVVSLDGTPGCNHIPIHNNVPDADALAAVQGSENCYSIYETFPGGFTPRFSGEVEDLSIVGGIRGQLTPDWDYDAAVVYGVHKTDYFLRNTVNPQLAHQYAAGAPVTAFNPGGHEEEDIIITFDVTGTPDWLPESVKIAWGLEYRKEEYTIKAGDPNSWFVYENDEGAPALAQQGLSIGANGYVGFPDDNAGSNDRSNYAAYADFNFRPTDKVSMELALRYEDYEDFGDTLDTKLAGRWQATETFALRGALGTGFRAPTVGQSNTRKVSTEFSGGALRDSATLPPDNPVARHKGAKPLEPEEALHMSFGAVLDTGSYRLTANAFRVELDNRIGITSDLPVTDEDRQILGAVAGNYDNVRFFLNNFNTKTEGLEAKYSRTTHIRNGSTVWTLNVNWSETEITRFDPALLDRVARDLIEESLPKLRVNLAADHAVGNWRVNTRLRYYDSFYNNNPESAGQEFEAGEKWLVDLELGHALPYGVTFSIGAENLFDTYPDTNPRAGRIGDRYAVDSPFGFNGAFYYTRLNWVF